MNGEHSNTPAPVSTDLKSISDRLRETAKGGLPADEYRNVVADRDLLFEAAVAVDVKQAEIERLARECDVQRMADSEGSDWLDQSTEMYIAGMTWSHYATENEKTITIANVRNFASTLKMQIQHIEAERDAARLVSRKRLRVLKASGILDEPGSEVRWEPQVGNTEEEKLVAFFRSPEGESLGRDGDHDGLTPAETALRAIRDLRRRLDNAINELTVRALNG